MKAATDNTEKVLGILTEIRDGIVKGNDYAARTAANTAALRTDVRGIRIGDVGAKSLVHEDPLSPAQRRQVDEVKRRYYASCKENPAAQLLPISRKVRKDDRESGNAGGYRDDIALNSRASREIKREQAGLPPF